MLYCAHRGLQALVLDHNNLGRIAGGIGAFRQLQVSILLSIDRGLQQRCDSTSQLLGCEHNCIPVLPSEFSNCRSLTEVNLGFNAIEIMPEVLKGITTLQVMRCLRSSIYSILK
jgi:hypothetical protein